MNADTALIMPNPSALAGESGVPWSLALARLLNLLFDYPEAR